MKLGSAGIVVLGMSGSFILILVILVVMLRPQRQTSARRRTAPAVAQERALPKSAVPSTPASRAQQLSPKDDARVAESSRPEPARTAEIPASKSPASGTLKQAIADLPSPEETVYWKFQQERKEILLLRKEMQDRLDEKEKFRKEKVVRLAETCTKLETAEAAQILIGLDDPTLKEVLERMNKEAAVRVAAVLDGLGRKKALSYVSGS